jgi:uncharacterized protein CbrC (UPF0167 family)
VPQQTFRDLGIPFPLFDAPISEASEYRGVGRCSLCQAEGAHCFELDIGADIVVACPACATPVPLDAADRCGRACLACGHLVGFPELGVGELLTCYHCLRAGRAALTKNTDLGMIRHEDATRGITHGYPGLAHPDFELVPLEDDWVGARLPVAMMLELTRTPGYSSIQGETWLFCCKKPMIYVGPWRREQFAKMAPDGNGKEFFHRVVRDAVDGLWEDRLGDLTGIYVFRCSTCDQHSAHWDMF